METAEQIDDRVETFIHFKVGLAFKTLAEFLVSILSNINRSELLLIHKLLKCVVTCFLEDHSV